jgi:hypothetical protein
MTANSVTGEVFYFTEAGGKIHRLSACDPGTGQFVEAQSPIAITPRTERLAALAVNPGLSWGALRPEGVLYAADQEEHSESTRVQHGIGDIFVPAKVFAPSVVGESVAGTTTDSTVLHAEVNPNGFTTDYRFQYVTGAIYAARKAQAEGEGKTSEEAAEAAFAGAMEAPVGGGTLSAGDVGVAAAGVGGIEAETEYRFRVIAASDCEGASKPACVASGETASFSTYPVVSPGLADGRAYELVSPPEKDGGEVFPADPELDSCGGNCKPGNGLRFPVQSSSSGGTVAYMGNPFVSEDVVRNEYLSKRTANGWQTIDLSPALQEGGGGSVVFDVGFGKDVIEQRSPQLAASAPAGYQNLYMQETSAPSALTPLIVQKPADRSSTNFELKFAGATVDLSRVYFSANDALTEETPFAPQPVDPGTFGSDLYEWHEGSLAMVNVLPGNTGVAEGAKFVSAGGTDTLSPDAHAVSVDGSRVFWSAAGHLYVRVDGQETLEVVSSGSFLAASADGMQVLLTDGLLYSFNRETGVYEQALDLTEGQAGFQGILGSAEQEGEFSRVYFVDKAALTPGAEAGTCQRPAISLNGTPQAEREEREGKVPPGFGCNLYLYEAGVGTRFIADLPAADGKIADSGIGLDDWAAAPGERTAEASPDGRYLAFGSTAQLTGYDNIGPCGVANEKGLCKEAYLYDSATGRLSCVSCNPTGEAPRGPSTLRVIFPTQEWFPQPRYLTDAGRLVFDSGDRLSAADTNGRVEDVYEYEPARGAGEPAGDTCERAVGCALLISPGTGSGDSNFLAMDETGANVFFTTRERLVPQDKDELIDLYDAREGGGFASQTETQRAECQGEACQATPVPPLFATPGSATFSGAGNLLQPLPAGSPVKPKKTVTRGKALAKKLRSCRRQRSKHKRVACEKHAQKTARRARSTQHVKKRGKR